MTIFNEHSRILITCPKGIPPYLRDELTTLGFPILSELVAGVETEGTLSDTMRINLHLRTGHRVLFLISEFTAENPAELYEEIIRFPWEIYIEDTGYLSVTSTVNNPTIRDPRFANVKVKDGIVDRFVKNLGHRPDSGSRKNRTVIHLFWQDSQCLVYLDTSGEPISRHGYRKIPLRAPLQETLAAATILATHWDGNGHFINPMCGSGTLAIEAALIALRRPPGLLRSNFGFMHIKGFDKEIWKELRTDANRQSQKTPNGKIIATDINRRAVEAAQKNAETAGVKHVIDFKACNFFDTTVPDGPGIIMLNPEYGERLGEIKKLKDTYRLIGDFFKQKCQGYQGYIFTGNIELAKHVGLRTKRRLIFFNSTIECRLLEYDIYEGGNGIKKETR
ncbi:MAG TPA: class I SAM-dependent RNA methyltransferase [Deltaproteobacteria bacterium]|nr:class I SAM-dependent RNA methyltransferase [Deltaproteobacteria bacterium]